MIAESQHALIEKQEMNEKLDFELTTCKKAFTELQHHRGSSASAYAQLQSEHDRIKDKYRKELQNMQLHIGQYREALKEKDADMKTWIDKAKRGAGAVATLKTYEEQLETFNKDRDAVHAHHKVEMEL